MSENENIFDLEDIGDLPESTVKQLRRLGLRKNTQLLLELFEIKSQLSIDEILVGLRRKYDIKATRGWVSSTIYNLKRRDLLKRVDGEKKRYEKVKNPDAK